MIYGSLRINLGRTAAIWLCGMALGLWLSSCATKQVQPGLEAHQPGNADERRIVQLLLELERAFNAADAMAVLALYIDDAGIMADLKGDRTGVLLTKEEYAPRLIRKMGKPAYRNCGYLYRLLEPDEFFIDDGGAVVTVPLEVDGTRCTYHEKAVFRFEFVKTPLGWRIEKTTWEVLESTHPKFKRPEKNR